MAGSDFNYRVALADGLRSLQAGRLSKAEEQFRYLREKFPRADGGYRGLAKVALERGEPGPALAVLREGAAALAKTGERTLAIGLLREILVLEPLDHAAHRRLAAALILAGDRGGAVAEYARSAQLLLREPGGADRAGAELSYAREQLGDLPELARLGEGPAPSAAPAGPSEAPVPSHDTHLADAGAEGNLEARALAAIASRDPAGSAVVIAAARAHLAAGRVSAATDLLLYAIATGVGAHDAERLLVDATLASGTSALARERAVLLARVYALDGRTDLAEELERLARSV